MPRESPHPTAQPAPTSEAGQTRETERARQGSVAVIGAGIIGLATCRALRARGYHVHLFDPQPAGESTSLGNAGLIANYATSPMANRDTLQQLPGQLMSKMPSVGIALRHAPALANFGWRFLNAATPRNFQRHKADLMVLLSQSVERQHALIEQVQDSSAPPLSRDTGCLQIHRDAPLASKALERMAQTKRLDGVNCQALGPSEARDLEPSLNATGLHGGLYYPDTHHLSSPLALSQQLYQQLQSPDFECTQKRVEHLAPLASGGWRLSMGSETHDTSHVVLCAGIATNQLLAGLGKRLPVVSERGYHVELGTPLPLSRPVGWLAHHFYATPMSGGIRLAGTTEFCSPSRRATAQRWGYLKAWGETLFGHPLEISKRWMGVRHSTPDGLPVIGEMPGRPGLLLAYGHGHLGLTMAAETGELVAGLVANEDLPDYAQCLSPSRFHR